MSAACGALQFEQADNAMMPGSKAVREPGLTISRTLIEKMGGSVGLESEERLGSLFWFSLPEKDNPKMIA
jgi:K+-sensing histidine kinase KdpD